MRKLFLTLVLMQAAAFAQPRNVLYLTHSAGFRHDSLPLSQEVLTELGLRTGKFAITATEDLAALNDLTGYSAVVFFTSGELDLTAAQKQRLLDFVRSGGGFAGIHSATDTLYTWPAYGDLIGARFDGHPWVQEVRIDVEDPDHPATRNLAPSFAITDEIYQFRDFSRDRVRVLMTLATTSVDMRAAGVNRRDEDFALAWTRLHGRGRVFYTALGHTESTWRDERFVRMLEEGIAWISGQAPGEGQVRPGVQTTIRQNGVGNAATLQPPMTISPGSFVSIYGTNLTTGSSMPADVRSLPYRLAGTRVRLNSKPVPIIFASPGQINVLVPRDVATQPCTSGQCMDLSVEAAGSAASNVAVTLAPTTPGIFASTVVDNVAILWSTGLGAVERRGDFDWTTTTPRVTVNGVEAAVSFSGLAPGWPGLYQINVEIPASVTSPYTFALSSR